MEYIVILSFSIIVIFILRFSFNIKGENIKQIKEIGYDKGLNEITNKLPSNKEVCEEILEKLNNKDVEIETSDDKDNSLSYYSVLTNKIIIANINDTFTRIQTIAHECLHSVQNKTMLMFNFVFSNIYIFYFVIILLFTIFKVIKSPMIWLIILILLGIIYYAIRSFLETDAMTKAPYVAEKYLENTNKLSKKEIEKVMQNNEELNKIGIPMTNFKLANSTIMKVVIYDLVAIIMNMM